MQSSEKRFLERITVSQEILSAGLLGVAAVVVIGGLYGYTRLSSLSGEVSRLSGELASSTSYLQTSLYNATTSLSSALQEERDRIGGVQDQVGTVAGRVTDLTKLSKIDPELLAKYSKVFFLSENYAPERVVEIPSNYEYNENNHLQIIPQVLPFLKNMLDAAKADGVDIYVSSAYRSFGTQAALKGQYTVTYGAGTANSFSADQGYSEHQLGTAVDLITTGTGGQLTGFDKRPAYAWLLANAYIYGFILSYPESNGYYVFEPWHWRFVGVNLATDLHNSHTTFYNMDQRTIDTYLISLFD